MVRRGSYYVHSKEDYKKSLASVTMCHNGVTVRMKVSRLGGPQKLSDWTFTWIRKGKRYTKSLLAWNKAGAIQRLRSRNKGIDTGKCRRKR